MARIWDVLGNQEAVSPAGCDYRWEFFEASEVLIMQAERGGLSEPLVHAFLLGMSKMGQEFDK